MPSPELIGFISTSVGGAGSALDELSTPDWVVVLSILPAELSTPDGASVVVLSTLWMVDMLSATEEEPSMVDWAGVLDSNSGDADADDDGGAVSGVVGSVSVRKLLLLVLRLRLLNCAGSASSLVSTTSPPTYTK